MIECKNCHRQVQDRFCAHCGQKASVERITLPHLLRDLPNAIFHIERGFFYNLFQLFRQPGKSIHAYLEGKRKPFYHPASYLVIALVLNYLIVKITDLHFYDAGELVSMDQLTAQAIRDYDAMQWWFLEHTYIYILLAIPASTLFLYAVFRLAKGRFNVAETAAVVLFVIAQGVLIQTFIYTCFGWIKSGPFIRAVETVNMIILVSYAALAIYQLIPAATKKMVRIVLSVIGGAGLAVVWIASAYLLYLVLE